MSTAKKLDAGKVRFDLIPPGPLAGAARVFALGAEKYSANNWAEGGGLAYGRLFGAAMRHAWAWWRGEDLDPETGEPHLDHLLCSVMMLSATARGEVMDPSARVDDRPKVRE
jgi:hypothetical protein